MRVLITGAAGFIGRQLATQLLQRGRLRDGHGAMAPISELVLADVVPATAVADDRVRTVVGDVADPDFPKLVIGVGVGSIFHLAATLTMEAEAQFDRGLAVNVRGLMQLLEACRALDRPPRFVFTSSIAVFGGQLPDVVDDMVPPAPETSYGTHKALAELLIKDYSRHGFIDGRALRLPVVMIRPTASARPTVSDRIAAIVRETLSGRDVVCPLSADTLIPVASAQRVARALLHLHDVPAGDLGHHRAMNLPSLTVSIGDLAAEPRRFAKGRSIGRVTWEPDARLQAVVDRWPSRLVSERASKLGLAEDERIGEIVDGFAEASLPSTSDALK
ncbi:MAG: NAD-dependent epimerase/dehydratase family protein [Hyphomicrobiaceae bacterium]|nr:NAD-dependent epimerase/dehydratase family protein [Hyphomicrobiaceae bacterium]